MVVDDGSGRPFDSQFTSLESLENVTVRRSESTQGIATSLNRGFEWAVVKGYDYVLTLDQDTLPAEDLLECLMQVYFEHPRRDRIAVVAPKVVEAGINREPPYLRRRLGPFFQRTRCFGERLDRVTTVISSGSLHPCRVHTEVGPFREDFFIDYVDTEYCLRATILGYEVAVACKAEISHRLGEREKATIGPVRFFPTFHSPSRWYYISRNRMLMIQQYGSRFPHWLTYEIMASGYSLMRMLFFEDRRQEKLRAVIEGTRDGIAGRMGARLNPARDE